MQRPQPEGRRFWADRLVEWDDAGVDEAYVFGLPTAEGDELVGCALVTALPASEHAALVHEVTTWAGGEMARYKVPTDVRVLAAAELPLTATGKVARRALQEQQLSR